MIVYLHCCSNIFITKIQLNYYFLFFPDSQFLQFNNILLILLFNFYFINFLNSHPLIRLSLFQFLIFLILFNFDFLSCFSAIQFPLPLHINHFNCLHFLYLISNSILAMNFINFLLKSIVFSWVVTFIWETVIFQTFKF